MTFDSFCLNSLTGRILYKQSKFKPRSKLAHWAVTINLVGGLGHGLGFLGRSQVNHVQAFLWTTDTRMDCRICARRDFVSIYLRDFWICLNISETQSHYLWDKLASSPLPVSVSLRPHNEELAFLNGLFTRQQPGTAQLALVYGRRRVGKTELLLHWARNSGVTFTLSLIHISEPTRPY